VIKQYLENHYSIGRLNNCYLINTDSIENGLLELNEFISSKLLNSNIENHPDYICIQKLDNKTKNISVDQIRSMQKFLYKTSVITGKKIAVIYASDQMNINAANSCLKILEDTPSNTYIFLITNNAASVIPTIRSRCVKINYHYITSSRKETDARFLKPLSKKTHIVEKLEFIAEFAYKAIFDQFKSKSQYYLQIKYDKIKKIIDDTNLFDLDLRSSSLLLIDKFRS